MSDDLEVPVEALESAMATGDPLAALLGDGSPAMGSAHPLPHELWHQADMEHPRDAEARGRRYAELMREHGHLVEREEGDDSPLLECGWDPRRGGT